MMLPVIYALTTSVWWARKAATAMINSAAFPKLALRKPPSVGPARRARCSVAIPISPAAGTSETAAHTNTQLDTPEYHRSHRLSGAARRRRFSQLPVTTRNTWAAADDMGSLSVTPLANESLPSLGPGTWK
jgi:hypothetical protein